MHFKISEHYTRQSLLASVGFAIGISVGCIFGISSTILSQMKYDRSIVLNSSEESWIASAPTILMCPACLLSALIMEKAGRRLTLLSSELLSFMCWMVIYFATDYTMLLTARLLNGIYMGVAYAALITYLGEISIPKYRTVILTIMAIGTTLGTFLCQYLGEYLQWRIVAAIFAFCPLYDILILLNMKESYVTSLDRNRIEEARQLFEWYRGSTPEAKAEFDEIVIDKRTRNRDSFREVVRMCMSKTFLIPFGITTLVFLTNEVTAVQAVIFYTTQIIEMINDDADFAFYATLSLNILRIFAVTLSVFLVKVSTVRFTLICSGYCLGISLLLLALLMYLTETYANNTVFPILSLCALVMNTVLYSVGLGPLPSAVCAEMYPEATRSIGGSISAAMSFLFLFIVVKFIPELLSSIGSYWTFSIFGICTLIGITASHLVMPNTKNKTLQEINMMYQNQTNVEIIK